MVSPGPVDTPIYDRAASATGLAPAVLPDAHHPDEVAKALVETGPQARFERIVGGESRLADALYRRARPAAELLLVAVDRWFRTGTRPAAFPGALWEPIAAARLTGGIPARASGDLRSLARNLAGAAERVARTAPALLRPVPERSAEREPASLPTPDRAGTAPASGGGGRRAARGAGSSAGPSPTARGTGRCCRAARSARRSP